MNLTLRGLLGYLNSMNLIDSSGESGILERMEAKQVQARAPWYIQVLLGSGAWVAAIFFILFMYEAKLVRFDSEMSLVVWGVIYISGAIVMRRFTKSTFPVQLALAMSVAGHLMFLIGFGEAADAFDPVPFAALILGSVIYVLYPDTIHRFLSGLLVTVTFTIWIILHKDLHHGLHILVLSETLLAGWLFLDLRRADFKKPLAWALALSVPMTLFLVLVPKKEIHTEWWPSSLILTAALLALYLILYRVSGKPGSEPFFIAAAATLALGAFTTPGLVAGIGLIVLGYAVADYLLVSMGLVFVPGFIIVYYYEMNVTLLHKSLILMGSGLILLGFGLFLRTRPWYARRFS